MLICSRVSSRTKDIFDTNYLLYMKRDQSKDECQILTDNNNNNHSSIKCKNDMSETKIIFLDTNFQQ